jgi:protein-tyrosine phosphatase
MTKRVGIAVFALIATLGSVLYWNAYVNFRFEEIAEDRVYKSALIPPEKLESFLIPNNIKTVVNLIDPGVQDAFNPGDFQHIRNEDETIRQINEKHGTDIRHVSIPSGQVPTKKTLRRFFEVMDDEDAYPVLIHCYHGTGRAVIYSALYRVEYEGWENEAARMETRAHPLLVDSALYQSSFAEGEGKGDFLIEYVPRSQPDNTIGQLAE